MMTYILPSLISRLSSDATLDGMLARSIILPTEPAVYATSLVPATAELPYIVITGPVSDLPDDTFETEYREVLIDVQCYTARPDMGGGSVVLVNTLAERVRDVLHRKPLNLGLDNPRNILLRVAGPQQNDDDTAYGRVLQVRFLMAA
jgi:hypothetical protein